MSVFMITTTILALSGLALAQDSCSQISQCMIQDVQNMPACIQAYKQRAQAPVQQGLTQCKKQLLSLEANEMDIDRAAWTEYASCLTNNANGCPPAQQNNQFGNSNFGGNDYGDYYGGSGNGQGNSAGGPGGMDQFAMQYAAWELPCKALWESTCYDTIQADCRLEERCDNCLENRTVAGQSTTFYNAYETVYKQMDAVYEGPCKAELEAEWSQGPGADYGNGQWGSGNGQDAAAWGQQQGQGQAAWAQAASSWGQQGGFQRKTRRHHHKRR